MFVPSLVAGAAFAGGALGPGIPVQQVVPPPTVLAGVFTLEVQGPPGLAAEVTAALADPERATNMARDEVGKALLGTATQIGSAYVGGLVGGGIGGKLATGLTKTAGGMVADQLDVVPLKIDDGLRIDVLSVVPGGGDALVRGSIDEKSSDQESTKKEPLKNDDGTFAKDADGNIIYTDIACRTRNVTVSFAWTVTKGGTELHHDTWNRTASDSRCGEDLANLASTESLAAPLRTGWGTAVVAAIAPAWRFDRLAMDKAPHLGQELKLIKDGEYDKAVCGLLNAITYDPTDAVALLDAGVVCEAQGRFDDAEELYHQATDANPKDKTASKALERLDGRRTEVETLIDGYRFEVHPIVFDAGVCPPMPVGRRVTVSRDTELQSANGVAIAELERGMRLFVTAEGGDRLAVELTDGTKGFVDPRRVK